MGGSRKVTIGHRYYVGLHLVLCRQADALLQINMAAKEAWRGGVASGRGFFNKPNLFGGDEREGGVSGNFDFDPGAPAQPVNDYLSSVLGPLVPAYRGVVSLVFRRPYIGANTARLPPMKFKLLNIAGIHRGWYPERAIISPQALGDRARVFIAWDIPTTTTPAQLAAMKTLLKEFVTSLAGSNIALQMRTFADIQLGTTFFDAVLDDASIAAWHGAIDSQPNAIPSAAPSDWYQALEGVQNTLFGDSGGAGANFDSGALSGGLGLLAGQINSEAQFDIGRDVIIFLSLADPDPASIPLAQDILAQIPAARVYTFKIDDPDTSFIADIDNTPEDGLPIIDTTDPDALNVALAAPLLGWADMNPAHIIRCLWTDPMRGGIATDAEIGDSFLEAADLFYAERLGLSPRFNGAGSVEADRLDVERHADCISYRSRVTGKIEIKPIRNDYNPIDLPVLDSGIVLDWSGLEREIASETPNQLTVIYTKRENGDPASVTRTNIAGVRRSGRVIPAEPVDYPACTTEALATRLCLRDLSVQVRPLLSGSLVLAYFPPDLDIGEPFIINEPKLLIDNLVVRIVEVQEGNGQDNSVTVRITEDRYAIPAADALLPTVPPPTQENQDALPSPVRVVMETPYYLAVLDQGEAEIDDALTADPDLGLLLATGIRATAVHRDITVGIDDGAGYVDAGQVEFVTGTPTLADLGPEGDAIIVTVAATPALDGVVANSLALIGGEIVRIVAMVANGTDVDIEVGRGCLDTVPARHAAGTFLIFLQNADPRDQQYTASTTLGVKLLTNLTARRPSLFTAPEDMVTFDSRAIRPYPPGNLQVNGSLEHDQFDADVVLTWAHRDRTLQTTLVPEDHTAGNIGPEAGTTYRVRAEALDEEGEIISTVTNVNVGAVTTYDWDDTTVLPDGTNRVRFTIASERGAYESWQRTAITTAVLYSPADLEVTVGAGAVDLEWVDLNSGGMQEDDILIYRDTVAFDLASLPSVLATLAADTETYTDSTVSPSMSYFYAVVMRRGSLVAARFSEEIFT